MDKPKQDDRRRRYVPLDIRVAFGPFGVKLKEKWGMEGLCSWVLLLAAAKREPNQGTFTYTSEYEAWGKLGATAVSFTFEEFISYCGRNRQTRRRRSGEVSYVIIRGWQEWNKEFARQRESEQKSRSRGENTPDIPPTLGGHSPDDRRTEVEVEGEVEGEVKNLSAVSASSSGGDAADSTGVAELITHSLRSVA